MAVDMGFGSLVVLGKTVLIRLVLQPTEGLTFFGGGHYSAIRHTEKQIRYNHYM